MTNKEREPDARRIPYSTVIIAKALVILFCKVPRLFLSHKTEENNPESHGHISHFRWEGKEQTMSGRRERRSSSKSSKNKKDKNDVPIKAEEEAGAEDDEAEVEVDEEYSPSSTNDTKKTRKVKESVIDHTYRDYSLVEVADEEEVPNVTGGEDGAPPTARAASSGVDSSTGKHSNFPAKLHAILSNPGYQHIICWMVSSILYYLSAWE